MLKPFTRKDIEKMIKTLDKRTDTFTEEDFDDVINIGYAELVLLSPVFSNEEVVPLDEYYEVGETKITLDITEDVDFVYDLYVTRENQDVEVYLHGIDKIRDESVIYKDSRAVGRVHVNLDNYKGSEQLDNVVIKYAYTPSAISEIVYMDQQTMLVMRDALGCALYNRLNDTEREKQKRASLIRAAKQLVPKYPYDYQIPLNNDIPDEDGRVVVSGVFRDTSLRF
jgi:hypothetical protein